MVNENLKFKTAPINYAVHKVDLLRSKVGLLHYFWGFVLPLSKSNA